MFLWEPAPKMQTHSGKPVWWGQKGFTVFNSWGKKTTNSQAGTLRQHRGQKQEHCSDTKDMNTD